MSTENKVFTLTISRTKDVETGTFADNMLDQMEADFLKDLRLYACSKATTEFRVVSCVLVE
jgi:hypothetical protein